MPVVSHPPAVPNTQSVFIQPVLTHDTPPSSSRPAFSNPFATQPYAKILDSSQPAFTYLTPPAMLQS
jgi:hypothetical protein